LFVCLFVVFNKAIIIVTASGGKRAARPRNPFGIYLYAHDHLFSVDFFRQIYPKQNDLVFLADGTGLCEACTQKEERTAADGTTHPNGNA
jgi:hypothetical protein